MTDLENDILELQCKRRSGNFLLVEAKPWYDRGQLKFTIEGRGPGVGDVEPVHLTLEQVKRLYAGLGRFIARVEEETERREEKDKKDGDK